jgi:hypothetical protein
LVNNRTDLVNKNNHDKVANLVNNRTDLVNENNHDKVTNDYELVTNDMVTNDYDLVSTLSNFDSPAVSPEAVSKIQRNKTDPLVRSNYSDSQSENLVKQCNIFGGLSDNAIETDNADLEKKNYDLLAERKKLLESITSNVNLYKMNNNTIVYYAHDMISSGKKYIVSKMCADQHNSTDDIFKKISMTEVNFQIILSRFVYTLNRTQQKLFGNVLECMYDILVSKKINPICIIPKSYDDLRKLYLDGELAITKHIPIPLVQQVMDHSYVSLLDCVADFLIRKDYIIKNISDWESYIKKSSLENDMQLFVSNRVIQIINDAKERLSVSSLDKTLPIVPLFISFWSDDFDPNKSIKSNRQSVWIKTATIFTMNDDGEKIKVTYPLSLSVKGLNHEQVEALYVKELEQLRSEKLIVMYSRSHNSVVYVHADLFCVLNDQPERRNNLNLANGNSSHHGRFGYILDARKVK